MSQLSVIVITFNASETLAKCLESVQFASQIVVLDSGSDDDTLDIASRFGCEIHQDTNWQGFGIQKNRALAFARHDWVLSIDSDEWVTAPLRKEIQSVVDMPIATSPGVAFELPRQSFFLNHPVRHSGWWPDYVLRLFVRQRAQFTQDLVHERAVVDGPIGRLRSPLMHDSIRSLEQAIAKSNRYSTESATQMYRQGRSVRLTTAFLRAFWAFVRVYFLQRGFLDGAVGVMIATLTAQTTFYRYAKLWQLYRPPNTR